MNECFAAVCSKILGPCVERQPSRHHHRRPNKINVDRMHQQQQQRKSEYSKICRPFVRMRRALVPVYNIIEQFACFRIHAKIAIENDSNVFRLPKKGLLIEYYMRVCVFYSNVFPSGPVMGQSEASK